LDTAVAADWPSFRGPNHDGKSAETITWPKTGPKQLWKINLSFEVTLPQDFGEHVTQV